MTNIDKSKAKQLLEIVRDFILRDVVPKDPSGRRDIIETFNQLIQLLEPKWLIYR